MDGMFKYCSTQIKLKDNLQASSYNSRWTNKGVNQLKSISISVDGLIFFLSFSYLLNPNDLANSAAFCDRPPPLQWKIVSWSCFGIGFPYFASNSFGDSFRASPTVATVVDNQCQFTRTSISNQNRFFFFYGEIRGLFSIVLILRVVPSTSIQVSQKLDEISCVKQSSHG